MHEGNRRRSALSERAVGAQAVILGLLATGMQDVPIAKQLGVSRRTVERRVARLMEVLGARTRFQAALLAREKDWI